MGYTFFLQKTYIGIFLPRKNTLP